MQVTPVQPAAVSTPPQAPAYLPEFLTISGATDMGEMGKITMKMDLHLDPPQDGIATASQISVTGTMFGQPVNEQHTAALSGPERMQMSAVADAFRGANLASGAQPVTETGMPDLANGIARLTFDNAAGEALFVDLNQMEMTPEQATFAAALEAYSKSAFPELNQS